MPQQLERVRYSRQAAGPERHLSHPRFCILARDGRQRGDRGGIMSEERQA
jgi:hypothetical protein